MIKIAGMLALALTVLLTGWHFSQKVRQRVKELEAVLKMLSSMHSSIRYGSADVWSMTEQVGHLEACEKLMFLSKVCAERNSGKSFAAVWKEQLFSLPCAMKEEEKQQLCLFGEMLGTTDLEGQIHHCEMYEEYFHTVLLTAKEEAAVKMKLYQSLSVLASVGVVVLCI